MEVPAEITTNAFFPGSFSLDNLLISPQPNINLVGMYKLNTGFAFMSFVFKVSMITNVEK
jgi:hypothetical protein